MTFQPSIQWLAMYSTVERQLMYKGKRYIVKKCGLPALIQGNKCILSHQF